MNLFTWGYTTPQPEHANWSYAKDSIDQYRSAITLDARLKWPAVWLMYEEQVFFKDAQDWRPRGRYFGVTLNFGSFRFGSEHLYYDGPHCSWSLGFLHFAWSWDWCKKCEAEL